MARDRRENGVRALGTVDRLVYAPASLDTEQVRRILDLSSDTGGLLTVVLPCLTRSGPLFN